MGDNLMYIAYSVVFLVLVGCFSRWMENRHTRSEYIAEEPFIALGSPSSTNAVDRRIEMAVRDAERGFRLCDKCLFTNRSRAETCVLCGVKLEKRDAVATEPTIPTPPPLTRRQLRARTRKAWTRQVNEKEQIVWHHDLESLKPHCASYVVLFSAPVDGTLQKQARESNHLRDDQSDSIVIDAANCAEGSVAITIDESSPVHTAPYTTTMTTMAPVLTIDAVRAVLEEEISGLSMTVTEVAEGLVAKQCGSVDLPQLTISSPQDVKDAVTGAQLDFPTKIAQFITATSTVFLSAASKEDGTTRSSRISILRDHLLHDSIHALATLALDHVRSPIRVEFIGEQGIDAGGVYREWFLLLNEAIVTSEAGVFVCVDPQDQAFYLNPHSHAVLGENHLAYVRAAGRLLGRALLEGNVTGFHLALPLLKIILGLPVGFDDLEYFDPDVYKNLKWLLENDGADVLGLDFTVLEKLPDGTTVLVELVAGGTEIDVTDGNKHAFVECKVKYLLLERIKSQLCVFLTGVYEVVPAEILMLFDAEELDYVLSGSDEIDVDDWEHSSQTSGNLLNHPALPNFWKLVRELSLDERRRLLQFATGSTRVPPGGFAALTSYDGRQCMFTLHGFPVWRTQGYIRSHACFNRLDLPLHPDLKTMRKAVEAAIAVDSFGFTAN